MKPSIGSKMIRRDSGKLAQSSSLMKCDLCEMGPNKWKNQIMQQCKTCGVCVHETCYGLTPTDKRDPLFQCMACEYVGKTVQVRSGKDSDAVVSTLTQVKRPTECALCSVSGGLHAMHPLYDDHGRDGRHQTLPANEKKGLPRRPAWVHSLCGFTLLRHGSLVYACDEKGRFADEDGEWRYSEDESVESEDDDDDDNPVAIHHFVECSKVNGEHTPLSAMVENNQKRLVCSICGKKDWKKGCLRFSMQCTAGDDNEHFRNCHPEISEPCTVAMHVGCARWKRFNVKHVYFYPGERPGDEDVPYKDPVSEVYCEAHATEVSEYMQPRKLARRTSNDGMLRNAIRRVAPPPTTSRAAPQKVARLNTAHQRRLMRKESGMAKKSQSKKAFLASKAAAAFAAADTSAIVSPSWKGSTLNRPTKRNTARQALQLEEAFAKPLKPSKSAGVRKRSHSAFETKPMADIDALAFPTKRSSSTTKKQRKEHVKETVAKPVNVSTVPRKKTGTREKWFKRCSKDLIEKVREAKHLGQDTTSVSIACRDLWIKKTTIPTAEFMLLWKEIDLHARKTLSAAKSAPKVAPGLAKTKASRKLRSISRAVHDSDEGKASGQKGGKRNWNYLLVSDPNYSGGFEFGEWDSIRVIGMN